MDFSVDVDIPVDDALRSDEPEINGFGDFSNSDDSSDESCKVHENSKPSNGSSDNSSYLDIERSKKMKTKGESNIGIIDDGWSSEAANDDDEFLSVDGSDDDAPKHPVYKEGQNMDNFKLMAGMKFKLAGEFKIVLSDVSVRAGYELLFSKNERSRVTAVCKEDECEWRVHASLVMDGSTFQIKTLKGRHTCAKASTNWLANYKYLAKNIEQVVRENPNVKIDQLISHIRREPGVDVSKWKAIRAKKYALQTIRGVDSVQYEIPRDYCETVLKYNPESRIIMRTRDSCVAPTFGKLYYCLAGLKMNFLTSCRPIIGLDGCFLKTVHGGQLIAAIGRDGNDGLVPIVIAIVEVGNRETWTWFLNELLEDIGGLGENKWTFISDRQKGLIEALKDLVPDSEHMFCLRHMYQNFKKTFSSIQLKDMFWKAASTGNKNEFNLVMSEIAKVDPDVETTHGWLLKVVPSNWARSHFTTHCKSDVLVNNLSESFNSFILEDIEKPIITMLEGIRIKLMRKTQERKAGMAKFVLTS